MAPPTDLLADGSPPRFEVIDPLTVRYSWDVPMPDFLPKLAAPAPLLLALPSAYMKQFHASYTDEATLAPLIEEQRVDDWADLHTKMSRQNRPENPDLPTLEPWRPRTAPPAEQFVFERNPYFHRVDERGNQLPYVDQVVLNVSSSEIITAKTATGESDLQAAGLSFSDYTLLKHSEELYPQNVALWRFTKGSAVALFPNLNCNDEVWRGLFRDVRVRRAMSVCHRPGRDQQGDLLRAGPRECGYGPARKPAVQAGICERLGAIRPGPGQPAAGRGRAGRKATCRGGGFCPMGVWPGIIVETAGESTLETDVLELIRDHFWQVGLPLYVRTSQRDIFRSRALAGDVLMGVWGGLDNGVPTADMSPSLLAPTSEDQLQWPMWGMHYMSAETQGKPPDLPEAQELVALLKDWRQTSTTQARTGDLGPDAGDPGRSGLLDRDGQRHAATHRAGARVAERAGGRALGVRSDELLRGLHARHLLLRRGGLRLCCATSCSA